MSLKSAPAETRERILEAGADVFAEKGFRDATVREIVARAAVNLAAVNYHFRDKEGLYAEVLEREMRAVHSRHPIDGASTPQRRLRAFVEGLLRRVTDRGSRAGRLMSREMIEPTAALDLLAERVIRPIYAQLVGLVREIRRMSTPQAELAAKSVLGQILFYKHCAPVVECLDGRLPRLDVLAEHIVRFSLGGIRG
jgi:TetR/AcrR family transcriptional regulator, regulator of cefoperazone and chloramphenicol sensitivity